MRVRRRAVGVGLVTDSKMNGHVRGQLASAVCGMGSKHQSTVPVSGPRSPNSRTGCNRTKSTRGNRTTDPFSRLHGATDRAPRNSCQDARIAVFVDSSTDARGEVAWRRGLPGARALLVVRVSSSAVRAWIWRWMAAGLSPVRVSVGPTRSGWSSTAGSADAARTPPPEGGGPGCSPRASPRACTWTTSTTRSSSITRRGALCVPNDHQRQPRAQHRQAAVQPARPGAGRLLRQPASAGRRTSHLRPHHR